jgi:hypothetical protein
MIDETDHQHDAALARKRRIELRSKLRNEPSEKRVCIGDDELYDPEDVPSDTSPPRQSKPSIRGIKKHARYDPGVPMTKDELVAWRKEARRVRNRESAAASRKRTRDRIDELEGEVSEIKSKYSAALERIMQLEAVAAAHNLVVPSTSLTQDASLVSPCPSTTSSPQLDATPSISPLDSFVLSQEEGRNQEATQKYQHIIEMISRPNAAKITGTDTNAHPFDNPAPPPTIYECSSGEMSEISSEDSSDPSNSSSDEHEDILRDDDLGSFLLDALCGFDPHSDDAMEQIVAL